jgi:hypothetical protein
MRTALPMAAAVLVAGCTNAPVVRFRDIWGGASIETVEFTPDGEYLLLSTRYGDGDARRRDWYLHCVQQGCKRKLDDADTAAVDRWTDADVWPSPTTPELAIVREDRIDVFNYRLDRVVHRVDRDVWRSACLYTETGQHDQFSDLFAPPPSDLLRRQFWDAFLRLRDGRGPTDAEWKLARTRRLSFAPGVEPKLTSPDGSRTLGGAVLPVPRPLAMGNGVDRYGDALGLTTAAVDGLPVADSTVSQWVRHLDRAVLLPTEAAGLGWDWVVMRLAEVCRSRLPD